MRGRRDAVSPALVVPPRVVPPLVLRSSAVARRQHDFEFDQLVPLGFGSLPLGNRQQGLQALPRRDGLWLVHRRIIASECDNMKLAP